jgi:lysozyme family protein
MSDLPEPEDVTAEIDEVKEIAADLRSVLPTRIEAAVQRALNAHEGGPLDGRVGELHTLASQTARETRALSRELRAERLSRVEDLEVVVDLLAEGLGAVRGDVARLEARAQRMERELERVTWALDRVGTQLERLADDADDASHSA